VAGLAALALGRRRTSALALGAWLGGTVELAWARIAPGPRTADEVATMAATSAAIPFAASYHWVRGLVRARRLVRPRPRPAAVLLDRDGTLVEDVPYNGDPARVRLLPGVRPALDRLRAAGIPLAIVSNQSGVGRGLVAEGDLARVNARVEELAGPVGHWAVCTHRPEDGCSCRKPRRGLVDEAAAALGVDPAECVLVGDIGADVGAGLAAGARPILVPTTATRREELRWAPEVAKDLGSAVDRLLGDAP
jgi:histidinol-phosphate phosphatase family protein